MKKQLYRGKPLFYFICSNLFLLFQSSPALSQENIKEIKKLNHSVVTLYKQGKYSEAVPLAQDVIKMARRALGANHPSVAVSLNNLAALYTKLKDHATAETFYLQSLKVFRTSGRLDHPLFAKTLKHLALLYKNSGYPVMAAALYKQAKAIREKFVNSESFNTNTPRDPRPELDEQHADNSRTTLF